MNKKTFRECLGMLIYLKLGATIKNGKFLNEDNNYYLLTEEIEEYINLYFEKQNYNKIFTQKYDIPNFDIPHFDIISKYDFDELQALYLLLNFDYFFDKYGYLEKSSPHQNSISTHYCHSHFYTYTYDVSEICQGRHLYYDYAFSQEGVDFIKKRINSNIDLSIGVHNFTCLKNIMIDVDIDSILEKYKNLSLEEIVKLNILCHNNELFFYKYLEILNKCNLEQRKFVFQLIEPFSFQYTKIESKNPYQNNQYLDFIEHQYCCKSEITKLKNWIYLLNFIFNYQQSNNIKFNYFFAAFSEFFRCNIEEDIKRLPAIHKGQKNLNPFFMKEFEYYFLEQYSLIDNIINLENWKDILEFLIKIKELIYNNMPKVTGNIKKDNKIEEVDYTYYTDVLPDGTSYTGMGHYSRPVQDSYNKKIPVIIGKNFNLNIEQTLNIKNQLNQILNKLYNDITKYNNFTLKKYKEIMDIINCLIMNQNVNDNSDMEKQKVKKYKGYSF